VNGAQLEKIEDRRQRRFAIPQKFTRPAFGEQASANKVFEQEKR
jgi:hypothetical protein